jgi:uncharacterized metal-binding protein
VRYVLRPLPVLYACAGCPEFGYAAPRVGRALDLAGKAELCWLGSPRPMALARFPVYSLDACERRCAKRWLEERGVQVQRAIVLEPLDRLETDRAAARLAAAW